MFIFLNNYPTKLKTCTVIAFVAKHVIRKYRHTLIFHYDVTYYKKLTQHRGLCCCGTSLPVDTPVCPKQRMPCSQVSFVLSHFRKRF